MAKGSGGKAFTGILCFILGFIIAIVAEVAIIAGGVYWLLNTDLDSIFNTIGIENETTDDEGKTQYVYINTDTSSGGVSTVLDLVSKLQDLAGKGTDTLTLGEFTDLLPVADNLVDSVYSMLASTLDMTEDEVRELIDETELKATPIAELSTFLLDSIYQIQLDKVLELAGIQVDSSNIYLALAYGSSANTIDIDGKTYPLYYEEFTAKEAGTSGGAQTASISLTADSGSNSADVVYYTSDGTAIDSTSAYYSYISEVSSSYKLYYYVIDGTAYVAQRNSASDYSVVTDTSSGSSLVYSLYDEETATLTGGYYYDENGELVALTHRTLNDLVNVNDEGEAGIDAMLGDLYISDLIEDESVQDMFEGKTLGDLMTSNDLITYLFDGVYVTELLDGADDMLYSIFDGVYVSDLLNGNFSFDTVAIGDLLGDVTSDDSAIIQYIVYGISGLDFTTPVDSYVVPEDVTDETTGTTTQVDVTYYVFEATYHDYAADSNSKGATYTAYVVATREQNVDSSGALVYDDNSNPVYTYTITDAYYYTDPADETTKTDAFTSVDDINDRIDGLMNDLTIGEITDLGDSALAEKLADYTINEIDTFIDELTLADVMGEVDSEDSAIIKYLVYGINELDFDGTYTTYTETDADTGEVTTYYVFEATYHDYAADSSSKGATYTAYVVTTREQSVDSSGNLVYDDNSNPVYIYTITEVYYYTDPNDETTKTDAATLVNDVSDRIDGLMNDLTIGEIADLGDSALANKLSGYTINEIDKFIDELTLADVLGEVDSEDSNIIIYLVYGINELDFTSYDSSYTEDGVTYYVFTAKYHDYGGNSYPAYVVAIRSESDDGNGGIVYTYTITEVYYYPISGLDFTSTNYTTEEINGVIYYTYTATYTDGNGDKQTAYVLATLGTDSKNESVYVIQEVYYNKTEQVESVSTTVKTDLKTDAATLVNDISDRINGLMNDLTIGEIATNLGDTKLATKLSGYTVNEIDQFINDLTLSDVIEEVTVNEDSSNIMMYIVYGISGFEYDSNVGSYVATYNSLGTGDANSETDITTVYVKVEEKEEEGVKTTIVAGVYKTYENGVYSNEISGTPVGKVSARVEGLMNDLTIGELIDITDNSSVILKAIKDSTIKSLSGDISNLTIQELFYDTIYSAADAYGNASVSDYTIDQYVKVVYDSTSSSGTYYYYDGTGKTLTSCSYSEDYLKAGTLYWNSGSSDDTTIYQVVSFDPGYLYFVSDGKGGWNYVQYSTYDKGHVEEYNTTFTDSYSGILYTYGKPDGVWYFMLYETTTTTDSSSGTDVRTSYEKLYTIDQIGSLTTNAADNIEYATLYDLIDAELLTNETLIQNKDNVITIPTAYSGAGLSGYAGKKLSELTLTEMIDFFLIILNTGFFSTGS